MENVKYLVLMLLVIQTTVTVLLLRYIKTSETTKLHYISSTVVLLVELVKATSCILIIFIQTSKYNFIQTSKYTKLSMLLQCQYCSEYLRTNIVSNINDSIDLYYFYLNVSSLLSRGFK